MLKCAYLKKKTRDTLVEGDTLRLVYWAAQRADDGPNPPLEEPLLFLEVALLLRDEMAHHVEERGHVVLGLGRLRPPAQAERAEHPAQLGERGFIRVADGIGRSIKCDGGLAHADERRLVFLAHLLRVGVGRG